MPELPEVETVCRGLSRALVGHRIAWVEVRRAGLRQPFPADLAEVLSGQRIERIWRRAKYYHWLLENGQVLLGHLGMSGSFDLSADRLAPRRHDHVLIGTEEGACVAYHDPRRFGVMTLCAFDALAQHPLLAGLGPEPLSEDFTAEVFAQAVARRSAPIKPVLMDASVVVGIGNIYASEALFRAEISPLRPANSLTTEELARLVACIQQTLAEAIVAGGSTLRDHRQVDGTLGYFQHRFAVYDRAGEPCPNCHCDLARTGGIKRLTQAGRSTFYCAERQR